MQEDLADSLRTIAGGGPGTVYGGRLGQAMVSEVQKEGGFLTLQDLQDNRAQWRETIGIDHRGYRVVTASSPASSWGVLVRLGILGEFDLKPSDHNSVPYVHALTEVSKRTTSHAIEFVDPQTGEARLDKVLSEGFWRREAARIDFSRASPYEPPVSSDSALTCSPTNYTPTLP